MITCTNGHPNADDSKFCESCGTKLEKDPVVVDLDTLDDASTTVAESEDAGDLGTDDQATTDGSVIISGAEGLPDTAADDIDPADDDQTEDSDVDDDVAAAVGDEDDATLDSDDDGATTADQDDTDDDDDDQFVVPAPQTPILSVVAELETWASTNHVSNDPYVMGLSEAVRQRHDLGMWASIDPLLVLPEPRPARVPLTQVIRWLAVVRNVLVFLPVALTWLAISKATDAYRDWDPRDSAKVLESGETVEAVQKNFLDFWTTGGNGALESHWTITKIGFFDFLIILLIIVLALIISSLTSRAAVMENAKFREADAQRTAIGIKIRRSLYGKRQASPSSIAESLADALSDLNETTRDMAEVASRLERSSAGVETLTPQLEALNATAAIFASQTSQAITNSVNSLVSSVDNLNTAVNANLTSVFESAVSNLQEAGEQLARTSASLEYGTKLLKDDIESIRNGLRR